MIKLSKSFLPVGLMVVMLGGVGCGMIETADDSTLGISLERLDENISGSEMSVPNEGATSDETSPWTANGQYVDESGNHLVIYPISIETGYSKDGWGAMYIDDGKMLTGELDEKYGKLTGIVIAYNDDGSMDKEMVVSLTDRGDHILMQKEDGVEIQFMKDEKDLWGGDDLPAYEYPGPEQFYYVLYKYLIDEFGGYFDEEDVTIPCPIIIKMDQRDKAEILVYGDFWINNYNLEDRVLKCVSGGSFPGCIHVIYGDSGFEVTGMDLVEDGSNYTSSAKKIFGDSYDDLIKSSADSEENQRMRSQIIANYVAANDLHIIAYQDYGKEPISLPAENIDTFYGELN